MFCIKCGKETADGTVICPSCGVKLPKASWLEKIPEPVVFREEAQTSTPYQEANKGPVYQETHRGPVYQETPTPQAPAAPSAFPPPVAPPAPQNAGGTYFDGSFGADFGLKLLVVLITVVSLGFASPWGQVMYLKWKMSHTVVDGRRLRFTGTGGKLFLKQLLWSLLTVVTLSVYGWLVLPTAYEKWVWNNTAHDGAAA